MKSIQGLILPADTPPRRSSLKRQLLFFDSILIPSDEDVALVNNNEITEKFPNGMIVHWSPRAPFPRSADYADSLRNIKTETELIQRKGHIRFLSVLAPNIDPGANWLIYHNSISNPSLVQAAVPDANVNPPVIPLSDGIYTGGTISAGGYKSKYEIESKLPYNLTGVQEQWGGIAWARIARAIKFIRRAYSESACPVALDSANISLCSSLISNPVVQKVDNDILAQSAISLDVVDPLMLDKALVNMSWRDVLEMRKVILPRIAELRHLLFSRAIKFCNIQGNDLTIYRKVLLEMDDELKRHKDKLSEAWEGLRIKGILRAGGAVGLIGLGETAGLNILFSPHSILHLILLLVSGGLVGAAALSKEIKELIICKNKVTNHPLFFIEKLTDDIDAQKRC